MCSIELFNHRLVKGNEYRKMLRRGRWISVFVGVVFSPLNLLWSPEKMKAMVSRVPFPLISLSFRDRTVRVTVWLSCFFGNLSHLK